MSEGSSNKCSICFGEIIDEPVTDPKCESTYHRNHLAAWLLTSTTCPICRIQLSEDIRDSLKPKTHEEREKLQGVRDEFSEFFSQSGKTDVERWDVNRKRLWIILYFLSLLLALDMREGYSSYKARNDSLFEFSLWGVIADYSPILIGVIIIVYSSSIVTNFMKRPDGWKINVTIQSLLSLFLLVTLLS